MNKDELIEIGNQLSCPNGLGGVEMGNTMNESNNDMILNTIDNLKIENEDSILEIGHGNCRHLSVVLNSAKNIKYSGLEVSNTMYEEAKRINRSLMLKSNVKLLEYNGTDIPYEDGLFDKLMTVNTIYFYEKPTLFFLEMNRVLKKNGILVTSFVQKERMKDLPFVTNKFKLYDDADVAILADSAGFMIEEMISKSEYVRSKDGQMVDRYYSIVILRKQ